LEEYNGLLEWYAFRKGLFSLSWIAKKAKLSHSLVKALFAGTLKRVQAHHLDALYEVFDRALISPNPNARRPE